MSEYKKVEANHEDKIFRLNGEGDINSHVRGGINLSEKIRNHKQRASYLRRGDSSPAFNRKLYLLEG